jgi:hypothetical protein
MTGEFLQLFSRSQKIFNRRSDGVPPPNSAHGLAANLSIDRLFSGQFMA